MDDLDDILDDLLASDDDLPAAKSKQKAKSAAKPSPDVGKPVEVGRAAPSSSSQRSVKPADTAGSHDNDNFYSQLAADTKGNDDADDFSEQDDEDSPQQIDTAAASLFNKESPQPMAKKEIKKTPKKASKLDFDFDDDDPLNDLLADDTSKKPTKTKDSRPTSSRFGSNALLPGTDNNSNDSDDSKKKFKLDPKYTKKAPTKQDDDDFLFGDYMPSAANDDDRAVSFDDPKPSFSGADTGVRSSRRTSARFLDDDNDWLNQTPALPKSTSKQATSSNADWLGLSVQEEKSSVEDEEEFKPKIANDFKSGKKMPEPKQSDESSFTPTRKPSIMKSTLNFDSEDIFASPKTERKPSASSSLFSAPNKPHTSSSFDFEVSKPAVSRRQSRVSKSIDYALLESSDNPRRNENFSPSAKEINFNDDRVEMKKTNDSKQLNLIQEQPQLAPQPSSQPQPHLHHPPPTTSLAPAVLTSAVLPPPQTNAINDNTLQIKTLSMEKEHLEMMINTLKTQHDQEVTLINDSYKKRIELLEDTFIRREKRLKEEVESVVAIGNERMANFERERLELSTSKIKEEQKWQDERVLEMDRINNKHREELSAVRRECEMSLVRARNLNDKEISTISSANDYSKVLSGMVEKMEYSVSNLDALQEIVRKGHTTTLDQRENTTKCHNDLLKDFQYRLETQHKSNEMERARLEGLISTLELQLTEQTKSLETERYRVRQEENRLKNAQQVVEQEREMMQNSVAKERSVVEKLKERLMEEQSRVGTDLLQERETLAMEKTKFELEKRMSIEKYYKSDSEQKKIEFEMSGNMKALEEQRQKIDEDKNILNELKLQIENERKELKLERKSVNEKNLQLERGASRLNEQSQASISLSNELEMSRTILESNQLQVRSEKEDLDIRNIKLTTDIDSFRDIQYQFTQEKIHFDSEKNEFENYKRNVNCNNCKQNLGLSFAPTTVNISDQIATTKLYNVWSNQAEKDKLYLNNELDYLNMIRTSPYHIP